MMKPAVGKRQNTATFKEVSRRHLFIPHGYFARCQISRSSCEKVPGPYGALPSAVQINEKFEREPRSNGTFKFVNEGSGGVSQPAVVVERLPVSMYHQCWDAAPRSEIVHALGR
jgi:hypothetical protein